MNRCRECGRPLAVVEPRAWCINGRCPAFFFRLRKGVWHEDRRLRIDYGGER